MSRTTRVRPVEPEERERIIAALKAGESIHSAARRFGRSKSTVQRIARDANIDMSSDRTKEATKARVTYARAERVRLIDKALDRTEQMIDNGEVTVKTLYTWSMALAVLLDKRRQEDDDGSRRRGSISALMDVLRKDEADAGASDG